MDFYLLRNIGLKRRGINSKKENRPSRISGNISKLNLFNHSRLYFRQIFSLLNVKVRLFLALHFLSVHFRYFTD